MGIDDESSHPRLRSAVADCVTRPMGVRLFREPDAGNLPVRFDEREQETEPSQTGLRRAKRKLSPSATGRLKPLRLFSTLPNYPAGHYETGLIGPSLPRCSLTAPAKAVGIGSRDRSGEPLRHPKSSATSSVSASSEGDPQGLKLAFGADLDGAAEAAPLQNLRAKILGQS